MKKQHLYIESNDTTQQLHCITWMPEEPPKAVLQIVHGMEEYIDRYDAFATELVKCGWAVVGHDHLGHGESGRWERGFFTEEPDGHDILINDIRSVTLLAKSIWHDRKVFIFGHSMGSFFTRRYLTEYGKGIAGAIICGSGWYGVMATGTAYYAAKLIGSIKGMHSKSNLLRAICSAPFLFAFRSEGKNAWLSRNKENVRRYNADELCGFGFTCGGYRDMYKNLLLVSQERNYERLKPIPLLIISGADDPVGGSSSVNKIARQYRRLGFDDVAEKSIPYDRHEILFEDDADGTINHIIEWLTNKN